MNVSGLAPRGRLHGQHPARTATGPTAAPSLAETVATGIAAAVRLAAVIVTIAVVTGAIALATAPPSSAAEVVLAQAPASFEALVTNLRNWIVGLLVGIATLFITVGGIRLLAADGDPGEVERAKRSIRNGLVGYALAALAPMIVAALRSLVG